MAHSVKRAYKYRFHPTPEQAAELSRTFGCVRLVYNKALEERTRAYTREGRRVGYTESSAMLTAWKRSAEFGFLRAVSSVPLQQALRHLQAAFANFFAKRAKYPAFKSRKKSRASAEHTRSAFRWREGRLTLAKIDKPLDIVWSRPLPLRAQPSTVTVTVSRDTAGRWFVSLLVEEEIAPLEPVQGMVGALSTGEKIANPRYERADRRRLARAQRALSRKEKGSANRAKARLEVAKVYARIADRRRDHLHKVSTRLVRENQVIAVEDPTVRTMVKNHRLARAISAGVRPQRKSLPDGQPAVKQELSRATVGLSHVYEGEDVKCSPDPGIGAGPATRSARSRTAPCPTWRRSRSRTIGSRGRRCRR
ncbi:RNA-guided endonuclease InsQ/TnpB family protein [Nonomuraea sp. NPDC003201]